MNRTIRVLVSLLPLSFALAVPAPAGVWIGDSNQQTIQVIADGTSNTLVFTETTRLAICFDGVSVQGSSSIVDGSSNTILFGENTELQVLAGGIRNREPIAGISDGTSNTIIIGEISPTDFCLTDVTIPLDPIIDGTSNTIIIGEGSGFDICFNSVRGGDIADGTSNTIIIGEPVSQVCYVGGIRSDAGVTVVAVPEPGALAVLGLGLLVLGLMRLRRRQS